MNALPSPDQLHLETAQGWLGLGCVLETRAELAKITPDLWGHAEVLEVRWQMYADAGRWETCLEIATTLTHIDPESSFGWTHRSEALHQLSRTREAWDNLLAVADRFTHERVAPHLIPYNLARYGCRLGRHEEAKAWLAWAFTVSRDPAELRLLARGEPELRTLWDHMEII
jgi:hypothetical protein